MENRSILLSVLLFLVISFGSTAPHVAAGRGVPRSTSSSKNNNNMQTYIAHVQQPAVTASSSSTFREEWHRSLLPVSSASAGPKNRMVYSYNNVISGFAARLTESEAETLRSNSNVLQVYPDKLIEVHTTRTPTFLGLNQPQDLRSVWNLTNFGKGVIVGVVDTGITPDHPSFSGDALPPPPEKWKGECEFNTSACNNKLIGARVFLKGALALKGEELTTRPFPIDEVGHGTHVASTAAGWFVREANVLGQGWGTAAGMAPLAHVAMYRVCDLDTCANSDILAGIDAAIVDGVDVLSISIGPSGSLPFDQSAIAVGAFTAAEKGIFVSCSAGNSGPDRGTIGNEAPWVLTVAASTLDRRFGVTVRLGNGLEIEGESVYQPKIPTPAMYPLVFAGAGGAPQSAFCNNGSLDGMDVKGKIVMCLDGPLEPIQQGEFVRKAGGAGIILMNSIAQGNSVTAAAHVLPASQVTFSDGEQILTYVNSTRTPTAAFISKGTTFGVPPTPMMASFSSRGPSLASPGVLKPDITGPGVDILAAWTAPVGPPEAPPNTNYFFNVISGTSMSTPHLSGIAALIKSAHPDWSPAMIKSAIMTTADVEDQAGKPIVDDQGKPAGFFAMGAGHVNPQKALDPGLVYDIDAADYLKYLCGLGYTNLQVGITAGRPIDCNVTGSISSIELNYPAIMVTLPGSQGTLSVTRKVKNVGEANAMYSLEVDAPKSVSISVEPRALWFNAVNQEKSFTVTFSTGSTAGFGEVEGQLRWFYGQRVVRSPISVSFE